MLPHSLGYRQSRAAPMAAINRGSPQAAGERANRVTSHGKEQHREPWRPRCCWLGWGETGQGERGVGLARCWSARWMKLQRSRKKSAQAGYWSGLLFRKKRRKLIRASVKKRKLIWLELQKINIVWIWNFFFFLEMDSLVWVFETRELYLVNRALT